MKLTDDDAMMHLLIVFSFKKETKRDKITKKRGFSSCFVDIISSSSHVRLFFLLLFRNNSGLHNSERALVAVDNEIVNLNFSTR